MLRRSFQRFASPLFSSSASAASSSALCSSSVQLQRQNHRAMTRSLPLVSSSSHHHNHFFSLPPIFSPVCVSTFHFASSSSSPGAGGGRRTANSQKANKKSKSSTPSVAASRSTAKRGVSVAAASSSATTSEHSLSSQEDILSFKKKAHALYLIRKTPHVAMSSEAALRLVTDESGAAKVPAEERMTRAEAADFLRACHTAGLLIISPAPGAAAPSSSSDSATQMVYTDPVAVFDARANQLDAAHRSVTGRDFSVDAATTRSARRDGASPDTVLRSPDAVRDPPHILATDADSAAQLSITSHRRFWSFVGFLLSCQMVLFSYWTFQVYFWDTMEPWCYMYGAIWMCVFFSYLVLRGRGGTFPEMDRVVLSSAVGNILKRK